MWYKIETVRKGRWWFFWNFVVKGEALSFSVYCTEPGRAKIDAVSVGVENEKS